MVGDHGPSFLKEWDLGDDIEINLKKRQVPYFIWSRQGFDESAMSDMPENTTIDMCALTPLMLKAAGLPLSSYYSQILRLSENVQSLTGQTSSGKEKDGMIYFDNAGAVQDVYSGTEEADLVRKYYYMEYNRLQKKGRVDELFDP